MEPNTATQTLSSSDKEMIDAGIISNVIPSQKRTQTPNTPADDDIKVDEKPLGDQEPVKIDNVADGKQNDTNPDDIQMTDEALLKLLSKKTGKTFTSLKDVTTPVVETKVLTPEEQEQAAEKKKQDALTYGLSKKLFTKKDYDTYQAFINSDKVDVVMQSFIADQQKEDPELTEDDAVERFKDLYHLFDKQESFKYKNGMAQIEAQYNKIRDERYGAIVQIEDVYDGVQKNLANGKVFKSQVDDAFESMDKTLTFKIDNQDINVPIFNPDSPDQATKIKSNYLTSEVMATLLSVDGKLEKDALLEEVRKDAIYENLNIIVTQAAKSYGEALVKAYRKGRIAANFTEDSTGTDDLPANTSDSPSDREMKESGII